MTSKTKTTYTCDACGHTTDDEQLIVTFSVTGKLLDVHNVPVALHSARIRSALVEASQDMRHSCGACYEALADVLRMWRMSRARR